MPIFEDPVRNYFSLYKGKGSIFAVIAKDRNGYSAYVPAVSLGCDVTAVVDEICETSTEVRVPMEIFCAIAMIYGIILCYFGQRFFMATLFFFGEAIGVFIGGICLKAVFDYTLEKCILSAICFGTLCGMTWIFLWQKYGISRLSAHLSFITAGILCTSILYFSGIRK